MKPLFITTRTSAAEGKYPERFLWLDSQKRTAPPRLRVDLTMAVVAGLFGSPMQTTMSLEYSKPLPWTSRFVTGLISFRCNKPRNS